MRKPTTHPSTTTTRKLFIEDLGLVTGGKNDKKPVFTTLALGEEGGCGGGYTTQALGEEGGGEYTTLAIGEEGGGTES